jgi:hypothetical protein
MQHVTQISCLRSGLHLVVAEEAAHGVAQRARTRLKARNPRTRQRVEARAERGEARSEPRGVCTRVSMRRCDGSGRARQPIPGIRLPILKIPSCLWRALYTCKIHGIIVGHLCKKSHEDGKADHIEGDEPPAAPVIPNSWRDIGEEAECHDVCHLELE